MASSKVYIGNLGEDGDKETIEQEFSKFGLIKDVWIARNPPGFAFVVYNDPRDAEEAVRVMDDKRLCGTKIKVELSHSGESRGSGRSDRGGRGRGRPRGDRDREPPRMQMRDKSPPRIQFSRGASYSEPRRNSFSSPRGPPTRGPPMRGPPSRQTSRRSMDRLERNGSFGDRDRYVAQASPRDRHAYDRNPSRHADDYDGQRNGYRGDPQPSPNGYDRHPDRFPDRYDDRYAAPAPMERFREPAGDRAPDRRMDRGPDRFIERGMNRGQERFAERYHEPRFSRRSPPSRGPPMAGRFSQRSPPPRRGGRSPLSRGWGRSRSPIR